MLALLSLFFSIVLAVSLPIVSVVETAMVQLQPTRRAAGKHAVTFSETDGICRSHEVLDSDSVPSVTQKMIVPPCLRIRVKKTAEEHCVVRVEDNAKVASVVLAGGNDEEGLKGLVDQNVLVETKEYTEEEVRDLNETLAVEETEERSSLTGKSTTDNKINMSLTFDSESNDEVSRIHSFEITVDDEIVESSLEVTHEDFAELEKRRDEPLQKIVEGSDNSEEATCGASAKDLDHSDGEIESQDSKHGNSSSKQGKRSNSSNLSDTHSASLPRDDRRFTGRQDNGSVAASQRSLASKFSMRDAFRKNVKRSVSSRHGNGSETSDSHSSTKRGSSKHDTSTLTSKCSVKSKVSKSSIPSTKDMNDITVSITRGSDNQDESSVVSKLSNRSVSSKPEEDLHQNGNETDSATGNNNTVSSKCSAKSKVSKFSVSSAKVMNDSKVSIKQLDETSVESKLSKDFAMFGKRQAGNVSVATTDCNDNFSVSKETSWHKAESTSGRQRHEAFKALGASEIDMATIQVEQIKAALLRRIIDRDERVPALEKALEEELKEKIKFLEGALGDQKQKQIEADFTSYLVKASSWQTQERPVTSDLPSVELLLPPPSRAGSNLKVVEVESEEQAQCANDVPWFGKLCFWQNAPKAEKNGGAKDDGALVEEDAVLHSYDGFEEITAVREGDAVQAALKDLDQKAQALQLTFFNCADESNLVQAETQDTVASKDDVSPNVEKGGLFGRLRSFLAQKIRDVKVELTDFRDDLLDVFFANSLKMASVPERDDKTSASGEQSVVQNTCENSNASVTVKEAHGEICAVEEKSDPIGKVVSIES